MAIANEFRTLHSNTVPLRLPNAWDAGSARLIEDLGASAVATTSAGFAWALGYPDGRALPFEEVISAVKRMVRVLKVPLTVDIENGYADNADDVAENVLKLVELGIAGINIEDGPDDASLLAAKISAIKEAVAKAGGDLFINARCDVVLANLVPQPQQVEESIKRGNLYDSAGADGLFLPALSDREAIRTVSEAIRLPLNVMAVPGLADAETLGKLGVRRLSAGGAISQIVFNDIKVLARNFLQSGRSDIFGDAMPYSEIQRLFIGQADG